MREFFVLHRMVGRTWRGVLAPGYFEPCNFPAVTASHLLRKVSSHIQWLESKVQNGKKLLPTTYLSAQSCVGDTGQFPGAWAGRDWLMFSTLPPCLPTCMHFQVSQRRTLCRERPVYSDYFLRKEGYSGSLQVILGLRVGVPRGSPRQDKVWELDSRRALISA